MSKILKAILVSAYSLAIVQFLKTLILDKDETIIEINYVLRTSGAIKKFHRDLKRNRQNITTISFSFKRSERLPTDFKYILKWSDTFSHVAAFKNGQDSFLEHKCSNNNCFLTNDKSLLGDLRKFDALIFDVENGWGVQPASRTADQLYIFTSIESASHFPVCHPHFESYYNLTWSYRLDSDIQWSFISVYNKNGTPVGPKLNMTWIDPMAPTSEDVKKKLVNKKKPVSWYISHCRSKSGRENVARELSKALKKYGLVVDTYGLCGTQTCPRNRMDDCLNILERDYYFHLAFESTISEDYVTERILHPLLHYAVPIVYGGADYSRFLPPGSYIDAGKLNTSTVAWLIDQAIKSPSIYHNYFRWHNHYAYKETTDAANICKLCELLHQPSRNHTINNFREWWNPNYKDLCEQFKGEIITI